MTPEMWNASLSGDYLWSNVNFGEAVTEAMTPLTWSVIQFTLDDWTYVPNAPSVGNIGGRPYLNISAFATMLSLIGKGREGILAALESTLYMRLPDTMAIPLIPLSWPARWESLANGVRVRGKQQAGVRKLGAYLAANPSWFQAMRGRVREAASLLSLRALWDEIRPHVKQGRWCVMGGAVYSADYTMQLRRDLTVLVGADDANALIANVSEEGLLASLEPLRGLARVAAGEMTREAYLQQFGHRGPNEFELSIPRPAEDPAWLERELAAWQETPADLAGRLAQGRAAFDAAWSRLQARYPGKAGKLRGRIAESARRARLREMARSEYVRDRWLVRLFACRAGGLTGLGDDVFFLTLDELLGLLAGEKTAADLVADIPERRTSYLKVKALPPCPPVICGRFDPFAWAADPARRSDIYDGTQLPLQGAAQEVAPEAVNIIRGAAGSAGRVEGVVRCLAGPEEAALFLPGEILVAVQTDIAWTLIFPRAAAVITDVGAPLSHAAIVARELGIPAVVGCGDATARLKTGDRVRVDGGAGVVMLLRSADAD